MDRLGAGRLGGLDDAVHDQVALGRRRRPDPDGLVGEPDMKRIGVGVAVDRHRFDAQLAAGAE